METLVNNSNFKDIINSGNLVLIDFWATWCPPCRMMAPVVSEIAGRFAGRLSVGKCDVDENPETAASLGITNIPALLFFRNGKVVDSVVGYTETETLASRIESLL